jgi:hypothetical protein
MRSEIPGRPDIGRTSDAGHFSAREVSAVHGKLRVAQGNPPPELATVKHLFLKIKVVQPIPRTLARVHVLMSDPVQNEYPRLA